MDDTSKSRQFSRLTFPTASTLIVGEKSFPCQLVDISLRGALVEGVAENAASLGEGTTLLLRVKVEESPVVFEMQGSIAWAKGDRLGVQCLSIDVDSITHLRKLMELNLGDPGLLDRELLALS